MARAIVRLSMDDDTGTTNQQASGALQQWGFKLIGTGLFEAEDRPREGIIRGLRGMLDALVEVPGGGSIDHVWIYLDDRSSSD